MTDSTGPRTATIPRPRQRPAVDPARARRPQRQDVRFFERRSTRITLGLLAAVVAGALAASMLILPVKAWLNQREELTHREEDLARLEAANARLADDVARLETDEGITSAIREELGAVHVDEKVYRVVMDPQLLAVLPDGWLYPTIGALMADRAAAAANPAPAAPAPVEPPTSSP